MTFKYEFQGEKCFWNIKVLELSSLISFLKVLSNYSLCSWRNIKNKMALVFSVKKAFYWAV